MRLARRAQFAALAGLLHVGLVAMLLAQRTGPQVSPDVPALISIDVPRSAHATEPPSQLPVQLRPHTLPRIDMPEPSYPVEPPAAAITVQVAPVAPAASRSTSPGPQLRLVQGVDYLRPLQLSYPRAAKRRRAQGMVLVYVLVASDGSPQQVQLYRSSGDADLDDAAVQAVRKALFRPQSVDGVAVSAQVLVPVNFELTTPGS